MKMIGGSSGGMKLIGGVQVEPELVVKCSECGNQHTSHEVAALNIEEDAEGRDVITFQCPVTMRVTSSLVFLQNQ